MDSDLPPSAPFFSLYLGMLTRETAVVPLPVDSPETGGAFVYANDYFVREAAEVRRTPLQHAMYHDMVFRAWLALAAGRLKLPLAPLDTYPNDSFGVAARVTSTVLAILDELGQTMLPSFQWERVQDVLAGEWTDDAAVHEESERAAEEVLDVITSILERQQAPLSTIEAVLLQHWLCLAAIDVPSLFDVLPELGVHAMLVAQRAGDALVQLCQEHELEAGSLVTGSRLPSANRRFIPVCERCYAELATVPNAQTPLELVLALDQAEDPEMAAFLWHRISQGGDQGVFSPRDVLAAAQAARDAGDVKPATAIMIADDFSMRRFHDDDHDDDHDFHTQSGDLPSLMIEKLQRFGEPELARLLREDKTAYEAVIMRAQNTVLRFDDFPGYDPEMHLLPLAAVVIARAVLADSNSVAQSIADHPIGTLGWLARRLIAIGGDPSGSIAADAPPRIRRYQERALIHLLIRDGWHVVAHWEPERRAQAVLNPSAQENWHDVWYGTNLGRWLSTQPSLCEVGLVALGAAIILPSPPEPMPLLRNMGKGRLRVVRQGVRNWLLNAGYVRVHDVLIAALAEPMA